MTAGDVLVLLLLGVCVALALRHMYRRKKHGKGCCGCCEGCAASCQTRKQ